MNGIHNGPSNGGHNGNITERVSLVSVSEPESTNGRVYFFGRFKKGVLGRPVARSFWGKPDESGEVQWDRAAPEELRELVGHDLTGVVSIEGVDVEPKDITIRETGEVRTVTSATVVVFSDETLEAACKRSGYTLRVQGGMDPSVPAPLPAAFKVVGVNGQAEPSE